MTLKTQSLFMRRLALGLFNYWCLVLVASLVPLPVPWERDVYLPTMIAAALPIFVLASVLLYREAQASGEVLALHDELTGIGNRRAFLTRMRLLLKTRKPGSLALVLLDVDGLKRLNDHCGHQAGDELIKFVGDRLAETHASAYRIGGDEFALLIDQASGEEFASVMHHLEPFSMDFESCGHQHEIGLSYGQARTRPHEKMEDFFARADARLRQCKKRLYGNGRLEDRRATFVSDEPAPATFWDETDIETLEAIRRTRIS